MAAPPGGGGVKRVNVEAGGQMRLARDRTADASQAIDRMLKPTLPELGEEVRE